MAVASGTSASIQGRLMKPLQLNISKAAAQTRTAMKWLPATSTRACLTPLKRRQKYRQAAKHFKHQRGSGKGTQAAGLKLSDSDSNSPTQRAAAGPETVLKEKDFACTSQEGNTNCQLPRSMFYSQGP